MVPSLHRRWIRVCASVSIAPYVLYGIGTLAFIQTGRGGEHASVMLVLLCVYAAFLVDFVVLVAHAGRLIYSRKLEPGDRFALLILCCSLAPFVLYLVSSWRY